MALYFIENFRGSTLSTLISRGDWDTEVGTSPPFINTTDGRNWVSGVQMATVTSNRSARKFLGNISSPGRTVTVGFAVWVNQSAAGDRRVLRLKEAGTTHITFGLDANNQMAAWRGDLTTLLASTGIDARISNTFAYWFYVEIQVLVSDTVGTLKIWVNNALVTDLSGIDTQNGGVGYIDNISFGVGAGEYNLTDIYALDDTGPRNNSRLGDCRVDTLLPNADSSEVSWSKGSGSSANYTYVDDATMDSDTTYVFSGTSGQRDIYEFPNLPSVCDISVKATSTFHIVRNEAPSANAINSLSKIGGVVYSSAEASVALPLSSDVHYESTNAVYLQEVSPATGVSWTKDEINAAAFGIERV